MATYVPMSLELIDEGELLNELEHAVQQAGRSLAHFVDTRKDDAKGATCEVTLKLKLKCSDPEMGVIAASHQVVVKPPQSPSRTTLMLVSETQDGKPGVLVKDGGSDEGDPRQLKFPKGSYKDTNDGE